MPLGLGFFADLHDSNIRWDTKGVSKSASAYLKINRFIH